MPHPHSIMSQLFLADMPAAELPLEVHISADHWASQTGTATSCDDVVAQAARRYCF